MTLKERIQRIAELENVDTPNTVYRFMGRIKLCGSQLCIESDGMNDYGTIEDIQNAIEILARELGGTVTWEK